jgi:hypothetical protein
VERLQFLNTAQLGLAAKIDQAGETQFWKIELQNCPHESEHGHAADEPIPGLWTAHRGGIDALHGKRKKRHAFGT